MCKDLDPERLYWPSSPGYTTKIPDNNQIYGSGDNHYWGVWLGGDDCVEFERSVGRLFQYMACNLSRNVYNNEICRKKDLDVNSEVMIARQKASLGTET